MYKSKTTTDTINPLDGHGFSSYGFETVNTYVDGNDTPVVRCAVKVQRNDIQSALISVYDDKDTDMVLPLAKMIAQVGLCKLVNKSGRIDYLNHYDDCTGAIALFICETYKDYTSTDTIEITSATRRILPADNDNGFIQETKTQVLSVCAACFKQISVFLGANANKSVNDARRIYKGDSDLLGFNNGTIANVLASRYGLTEKQALVIALLIQGFSIREISAFYGNDKKTIKENIDRAMTHIYDTDLIDLINYKIAERKRKGARNNGRSVASKPTHKDMIKI